jgi:sarcosine oxidase subunit gamma
MVDTGAEHRISPFEAMVERFGGEAAKIQPLGYRTLVNLRGRPEDGPFPDAVEKAFGVSLPLVPNTWSGAAERAALWLGPDEWLLLASDGEAAGIEKAIRDACGDDPWLSVVDLSHNYSGLSLAGPAAREVLAKGCPLDLHPRAFGRNACAQSILAKTRMLLRLVDDEPSFEIWVRNSFARYMAEWLLDAAAEFNRR